MFRFLNYFVLLSLSPDPFFFIGWSAASGYYWEDTTDTAKKGIDLIKNIPTNIEQFITKNNKEKSNINE